MSYDLAFWKYKKDYYSDNQTIYESCTEKKIVQELENLPIDKILDEIITIFSSWDWHNRDACENPKGKGSFEIYTTPQFVSIYCYGMNGNDMNNFIDILLKYDCPLYDPQVPKRYDLKD